jgi:hypothetical protein
VMAPSPSTSIHSPCSAVLPLRCHHHGCIGCVTPASCRALTSGARSWFLRRP